MTKDEIILAQQARIEQLKSVAENVVLSHNEILPIMNAYMRSLGTEKAWAQTCEVSDAMREALSTPDDLSVLRAHDAELLAPYQWQPIETAPKGELIAIWIVGTNKNGQKWSDEEGECWLYCYHDNICGDWRTTRPSGHLRCVPDRFVTHWMPLPSAEAIEASEIALRIKTEEHQCCTEDLMEVRRSACECADTRAKL